MTALDQSPEMLAVAQQAAQQEQLSLTFHLASLEAGLPFAENQFDLLICALMLCHHPRLDQAIREFTRVLQPGGFLLLTDFHPNSVQYGWRTGFRQTGVKYLLPNMPHTRDTYLEALAMHGLTLVKILDLPLRALPAGRQYPPPLSGEFLQLHGEKLFCLILFAQKGWA